MASTDGVGSQRVGPWGRVAVVFEVALVANAWSWLSQLAAIALGVDARHGVHGGTYLAWAALATPAALALVLLALSVRGARPASIGLAPPPRGWLRALLVGLAWGAGLYAVSWGTTWLGERVGLEYVRDAFRVESTLSWLAWLAGGLLAGAFGEELVYRGWLLERVERGLAGWLPEAWATRAAVLVGALVFGAQHAYQGEIAVVTVTLLGVGLGLAFLRTGRNLVVPVVAHGLLDVVGLTELYRAV
jgi:membrane protease YdiL (CAAX protease family)